MSNNYITISKKEIDKIRSGIKTRNSCRIILHKKNSPQQEMLIAQKKNYYFPIKKNIKSDQTFTIITGKLLILIFSKKGKLIKKILLSKSKNIICRIKRNTYHCDISLSSPAIHLETKSGKFSKKNNSFGNFPKANLLIKKLIKKR